MSTRTVHKSVPMSDSGLPRPADAGKATETRAPSSPDSPAQTLAQSRGNAVKHGLTASTLLADLVGADALRRHKERLRAEWQPISPTEEFLVMELARHEAALELVEHAEAAVVRCGARAAAGILSDPTVGEEAHMDTTLAAAVTTDALDRLTRYRRAHEKAWHAALSRLREAKAMDPPRLTASVGDPRDLFVAQEQCHSYLRARWQGEKKRCPSCGHARGYWLTGRQRWQCAGCNRQLGLRSGTVMERSRLPLRSWFAAILCIVHNQQIPIEELAVATGIRRRATVQHMAKAIRAAMDCRRATELLAGLDRIARHRPGHPVPESSATWNVILRNET